MNGDPSPRPSLEDACTSVHFHLPRDVRAPWLARVALRDLLDSNRWPPADDAELIVSELVANAVQHGSGRIGLTLWLADGRIHGEVADAGAGARPGQPPAGEESTGGRGLSIVDALSDRWGSAETTSRVWFEITSPGGPRRRPRAHP